MGLPAGLGLQLPARVVAGGGIALGAFAAYTLFWWYEGEKCEKPKYSVKRVLVEKSGKLPRIRGYNEIEVREYQPYVVAEVNLSGMPMRQAMSSGFKAVARYIFGANRKRDQPEESQPVSMTSPVRMDMGSETITMRSPVQTGMAQEKYRDASASEAGSYKVSFVMPSEYTLETLPEPCDENVKLVEVPAHSVAVYTFFGASPSKERVEGMAAKLRDEVEAAGLQIQGDLLLYQYHPPFAPAFLRRNEVLYALSS